MLEIGQAIAKHWSWERLLPELAKCQLLCKRHHIAKTSAEREPWRHGTIHGYMNKDCRCKECRETYNEWRRQYRKTKTKTSIRWPNGRPEVTHGQRAMYLRGCKCPECKEANNVYTKAFMATRKRV